MVELPITLYERFENYAKGYAQVPCAVLFRRQPVFLVDHFGNSRFVLRLLIPFGTTAEEIADISHLIFLLWLKFLYRICSLQ